MKCAERENSRFSLITLSISSPSLHFIFSPLPVISLSLFSPSLSLWDTETFTGSGPRSGHYKRRSTVDGRRSAVGGRWSAKSLSLFLSRAQDDVESDDGVIINPCVPNINNFPHTTPTHNSRCIPPLLILGMNLKCVLCMNANATSYHSLKSYLLYLSPFQLCFHCQGGWERSKQAKISIYFVLEQLSCWLSVPNGKREKRLNNGWKICQKFRE